MSLITEPESKKASPLFSWFQVSAFATLWIGVKILPLLFAHLGFGLYASTLLSGLVITAVAGAITITTQRVLPLGRWTAPFLGSFGAAMILALSVFNSWLHAKVI